MIDVLGGRRALLVLDYASIVRAAAELVRLDAEKGSVRDEGFVNLCQDAERSQNVQNMP